MPTELRLALLLCALVVRGATGVASAEGARTTAASPERFGSDMLEDETRGSTALDDLLEVLSPRRAQREGDHHHAEYRGRSPAKERP